jgi:D-glycero-beta-D-manno-heptose-7-phosphate kinase
MKTDHAADLARLTDLIDSFPRQTIVVLGDFVADKFVFGEISRVSREAPVLILRHRETQTVPGGGANAANNLVDLGAKVLPVSVLGDDAAGDDLRAYFRAKHVDVSGLLCVHGWTTPTKARFLAGWTHTASQQVLRMDREPSGALLPATTKALVRGTRERIRRASAMVISDYGYGSAAPEIVRAVGAPEKRRGPAPPLRIALDSRYRLHEYAGLALDAAMPNEAEIEAAHHAKVGGASALEGLARRTMARMGLKALVVTRGRDGMIVFERGRTPQSLTIFGSDQAVDVTGAGDTVIATFTLALAAGATVLEAAHLANYAGGIVVMKRGTATVTRGELAAAIGAEATGDAATPQGSQTK